MDVSGVRSSCETVARNWSLASLATSISCWMRRRSVDRKSTRLNSSHSQISYADFCFKKKIRVDLDPALPADLADGIWDLIDPRLVRDGTPSERRRRLYGEVECALRVRGRREYRCRLI